MSALRRWLFRLRWGAWRRLARHAHDRYPSDFDESDVDLWTHVRPYTMTTPARVYSLVRAVEYLSRNQVPGAIVECGVWRGGSMMAVARTLLRLGVTDRELYLYDTFEGMTDPGAEDVTPSGERASERPRPSRLRLEHLGDRVARGRSRSRARRRLSRGADPLRRGTGRGDAARRRAGPASRCSASTPTGTRRPGTSSSTSTRGWRRRGADHRRLRPLARARARRSTSTSPRTGCRCS